MIYPTIHPNGTSAEALYEQYAKAMDVAEALLDALHQAAPNGRDYYPQGDSAFRDATDAHMARASAVHKIRIELEDLAGYCSEAMLRKGKP